MGNQQQNQNYQPPASEQPSVEQLPEQPVESQQPAKSKKLIIIIVAVAVLLAVGCVSAYFLWFKQPATPRDETTVRSEEESQMAKYEILRNIDLINFKRVKTDADPKSQFNCDFWKDDQFIYKVFYEDETVNAYKMVDFDYNTFKVLYDKYRRCAYSVDKDNVYYKEQVLAGADSSSFRTFRYPWAKDKNNVYFEKCDPLDEYNPNRIKSCTAKKLEGADPNSFLGFGETAKDKNTVYCYNKKIEGSDPISFKPTDYSLPNHYIRDNNGLYYCYVDRPNNEALLVKLEGADPESFEPLGTSEFWAKDKNFVYSKKGIDGIFYKIGDFNIDTDSFEVLEYNQYAKDKNFVYCTNFEGGVYKLEGADPGSFKVMSTATAEDKNFKYRYCEKAGEVETREEVGVSCEDKFRDSCCFWPDEDFSGYTAPLDSSKIVNDSGFEFVGGQILIMFKDDLSEEKIRQKIADIGGEIVGCVIVVGLFQINIPDITSEQLDTLIDQLREDPDIVVANHNSIKYPN